MSRGWERREERRIGSGHEEWTWRGAKRVKGSGGNGWERSGEEPCGERRD